MTNCPHLPTEDLVAWLDGELPPEAARGVERHVAACADCAREADLLRRSGALVAGLPRRTPSRGFEARVAAAVRAAVVNPADSPADSEVAAAAPAGRVLRPAFPRWAGIAAAAVVVALGGWWLTSPEPLPGELSRADEEAIARDLFVITHLDTLGAADADELAQLADDLDVIDAAADTEPADDGG